MDFNYCCEEMKYFSRLNCDIHKSVYECPDSLIKYSDKDNEYGLIIHDGGISQVRINFCPWCGRKL